MKNLGYMRPPRTYFNKPYEGYSYLEDLICWCMGAAEVRWGEGVCFINCQFFEKVRWTEEERWTLGIVGDGIYRRIKAGGDSPIEALESLLLKLVEGKND